MVGTTLLLSLCVSHLQELTIYGVRQLASTILWGMPSTGGPKEIVEPTGLVLLVVHHHTTQMVGPTTKIVAQENPADIAVFIV